MCLHFITLSRNGAKLNPNLHSREQGMGSCRYVFDQSRENHDHSLVHAPSFNMEEAGLMTNSAASHALASLLGSSHVVHLYM